MSWWDTAWRSRQRVVVHADKVGGAGITNFPVSLDLTGRNLSGAAADLRDIRFVDDDTLTVLDHQIERTGEQIHHTGFWTWFNNPEVVYDADGKMYVGWVNATQNGISQYDPATGDTVHFVLSTTEAGDDHNNPMPLVMPDGRIKAFWSKHDIDAVIHQRTTTNPGDITAWGADDPETVAAGRVTYPKPMYLSGEAGGRIYLIYRCAAAAGGSDGSTYFITSDDDGSTWTSQKRLVSAPQPYLNTCDNGTDRIDIIWVEGNPNAATNGLYHFYLSGGSAFKTDGTLIATLASLGTHDGFNNTQVTTIRAVAGGTSCWGWDVARDPATGHPRAAYQVHPTSFTTIDTPITHYYARWTGSAWEEHPVVLGGNSIATATAEPNYGPGSALLPEDPSVMYLARRVGGADFPAKVMALSPALYTRYGETAGTTAQDETVNNRDGTYGSGVTLQVQGGLPISLSKGVTLDNTTNGKITYTGYSPFTNGTTRSFGGLAKRTDSTGADSIFSGAASRCPLLRLQSGSQDVVFSADIGGVGTDASWTAAWPGNGVWVFWVLVVNEATDNASLYINGSLVSTQTFSRPYNATPGDLLVGLTGTNVNPFGGEMDEFFVVERGLTALEVAQLYQDFAGISGVGATPSDATELERWRTGDGGTSWTSEKVTMGSTTKNVRPVCPKGTRPAGAPEVVWWEGMYVRAVADFNTRLLCWPTRDPAPTMARVKIPTLDEAANQTIYMYYGNPAATSTATNVLPSTVLRSHSNLGRLFSGASIDYAQHERFAIERVSGFTIEVYLDGLVNDGVLDNIIGTKDFGAGTDGTFMLRVNADGTATGQVIAEASTQVGGAFANPPGINLRDGGPHKLALTYDTTNGLQLWVDGVKSATTFASTAVIDRSVAGAPDPVGIGWVPGSAPSRRTIGRIEDVRYHHGKLEDAMLVTVTNDRVGLGTLHHQHGFGLVLEPS